MTTAATSTEKESSHHEIDIDQYRKMIDADDFPDGFRAELLDGKVVEQMTRNDPHNFTTEAIGRRMARMVPDSWLVIEEKSAELDRFWRPEPDLAIIRGPESSYRDRSPGPADIGLLIEVAESSYASDRGVKWRRYAAALIAEYWIVNMTARQIEVYREPSGREETAAYQSSIVYGIDASVPVRIEGFEVGRIAVKDILP